MKIESCITKGVVEVKPCPFCGGEPELKRKGKNGIHLRCKSCGMGNFQGVIRNSIQWLEKNLIDSWNKRPETESLKQMLKDLRTQTDIHSYVLPPVVIKIDELIK